MLSPPSTARQRRPACLSDLLFIYFFIYWCVSLPVAHAYTRVAREPTSLSSVSCITCCCCSYFVSSC
jgi:hypothetical protein